MNFPINYESLEGNLQPKQITFPYKDVQHKLKKVAFDVVKFTDSENIDGLWQIRKQPDGEFIVALYDMEVHETKKESSWTTVPDKFGSISIFYKDDPITKIAAKDIGIKNFEIDEVCKYLPEKLASNIKLKEGLLLEVSAERRNELYELYPELKENK